MEEKRNYYVARVHSNGETYIKTPNSCALTKTQVKAFYDMCTQAEPEAHFIILQNTEDLPFL